MIFTRLELLWEMMQYLLLATSHLGKKPFFYFVILFFNYQEMEISINTEARYSRFIKFDIEPDFCKNVI